MLDIETAISENKDGHHYIHGHDVLELIEKKSFTDMLFLLWRGNEANAKEKELLEAMLVACVEHGVEAPSLFVPRVVASTGNDMNASLAASALTVNKKHGGAIEAAASMLAEDKIAEDSVKERLESKKIIPGLGHKIYKDEDPRATVLGKKAEGLGFQGGYFKKMYAIEAAFESMKGKRLPVNIDGALAAGMLELKLNPVYGMALFIIPRLVGAAAHIVEEQKSGGSYRRLK
ncbi:MAG: hypothetical protein HYR90_00020 [Candidatus Andersenbacteria bacterium]|nr:hypothetical protein [Candidatus Andersenbacteria bacterium]MBI3250792.1 hypothetical protein [Candidatus Andersenbacteria bacterium]